MARFVDVWTMVGAGFYSKPSMGRWPRRAISWLSFGVGVRAMRVRLTVDKLEQRKVAAPAVFVFRVRGRAVGQGGAAVRIFSELRSG